MIETHADIGKICAVTIRMYADDHDPPHFHIFGKDFEVLVALSGLSIITGQARSSQIAEAISWAKESAEILATKWAEPNERG